MRAILLLGSAARGQISASILQVVRAEGQMLYTIAVLLLIMWMLGLVGAYTVGSVLHVLLVVALVLFVVGALTGRRPVV